MRSVAEGRAGHADSLLFTVDTTAPTATPVILNPKHGSRHLRSPRLAFDNDDPDEPEFGYQCRIDGAAYVPCEEGLADSPRDAGPHTLQIKLIDGAGNVGSVESDSTPTVADDPATPEDESAGTTGAEATTFDVGVDPAAGDTAPAGYEEMTHPSSASLYAEGLHISTGAMEDPAGRVWVADHNAGFCRVTDPTLDGAGRIEHPEVAGRPRTESRTCFGGLLPDAGAGADAAGPPTFVDPTPKRPGNGDEVVLMADGFAHSDFLVRLRWDPGTELFEYLDQITVPAIEQPAGGRPRPVTTQIGPDPDGIDGPKQPSVFFANMRDVYIGRVDDPAGDNPTVHVAGYVAEGEDRAEVLAVGQRDEVVRPASGETPAVVEQHPVIYLAGATGIDRIDDPRVQGEPDAPESLTASPDVAPGIEGPGAMAFDLKRNLLYVGTANAILEDPLTHEVLSINPGTDRLLRIDPATMQPVGESPAGFSMVGGIGLRSDGRILVVDDAALLDEAEPMGMGRMYQIGRRAARITGGPSDPEDDAHESYTSSATPSFDLAGDTPRECWLRPAASTQAPQWQPCDEASFTAPRLDDGSYRLTVRATADPVPSDIVDTTRHVPNTVRFTVDTVAPGQPSVTDVRPVAGDGLTNAEPSLAFAGEAGAAFECRLNGDAYNKVPCRPGRTFPVEGTPRVADGDNTLHIRARDKAGNLSPESPAFTFKADATIPVVTFSSPEEGATTGTEARFVFRASELENTRYGCRLDGNTFKRCDRPSDAGGPGQPYAIENLEDGSVAVTYRDLSPGPHRFQVHASDDHSNIGRNATRNIHVSVKSPVALVDAPEPNATTGRSTTLRSHIDPESIDPGESNTLACTLMRDDEPVALSECDESIAVSGLQDGMHTFTVQATDGSGNVGPASSRTWRVDATAPVITITQQGDGVLVSPTFTVGSDEPATLLCHYDRRDWQPCETVDGRNLGPGQHTLFARGTDPHGNVGTASKTFTLVLAKSANTVVPRTMTATAVRSAGLPVTFAADENTALARFTIVRLVEAPATAARAARARRAAGGRKVVGLERIASVKRLTPKPGVYRRRLAERRIRAAIRPGRYRVETRLKDKAGKYGEPAYHVVTIKKAKKKRR